MLSEFDDSIRLQLENEETPTKDYMISIITIFDNLKFIDDYIECMMKYVVDKANNMINENTKIEIVEQSCNKILGEIIFEIKTFWNIFGSIMLPIRNYSPIIGKMYSDMKDNIKIDLLDSLFKIQDRYPGSIKLSEFDIEHKITEEYGNLINGFSRLLISVEKLSALENISAKKISDVNWSFMTLLMTSVNNIIMDEDIKIYDNMKKENSMRGYHYDLIVTDFIERINVMYNYINKTSSASVLNGRLNDFICAIINIILFDVYEELKTKFSKYYKKYNLIIDASKEQNKNSISYTEIPDEPHRIIGYINTDAK